MTLQDACTALETFLTKEWRRKGDAKLHRYLQLIGQEHSPQDIRDIYMPLDLFVSKYARELVNAGSKQILITLSDNWIAKTIPQGETQTHHVLYTTAVYSPEVAQTNDVLRDLGMHDLDVMLPEHHYISMQRTDDIISIRASTHPGFVITPDLTEGRKYQVVPLTDANIAKLSNQSTINAASKAALGIVYDIGQQRNPDYGVSILSHSSPDGSREAFEHLFFIRVDGQGHGQLVAGDQDHLAFYRKSNSLSELDRAVKGDVVTPITR